MQFVPYVYATPRPSFGRKRLSAPVAARATTGTRSITDDLRLFAMTFIAGFVFVSILLA